MRPIARALTALLLGLALALGAGEEPADVHKDVQGTARRPLDFAARKATVFVFVAKDCPISNRYAPELNRIHAGYKDRGAALFLIHADPETTDAEAAKHAEAYGLSAPVLVDRTRELARRAGAEVTPEAAVFTPEGKVAYLGRIDDLFVAWTKQRKEATRHDLREALDAVLAGKPVAEARTKAIGCFIPKPRDGEQAKTGE